MTTIGERFAKAQTTGFDYLRIGLAFAVMVWHTFPLNYGQGIVAQIAPTLLAVPVRVVLPLFFALSGFLVCSSLDKLGRLPPFLVSRVLRIGPALAVEIALSALIIGPLLTTRTLGDYFTDPEFFTYLLNVFGLIHYNLPGVFESNIYPSVVNGSLWTIPFELECYLALCVLFLLRFVRLEWLAGAILLLAGAALLLTTPADFYQTRIAVPGRVLILSFLGGIVAFRYRHRLPTSPLLVAGSVAASFLVLLHPVTLGLAPLVTGYTAAALGCTNPPKLRLLRSGDYSYGVYLYAFPMQQVAVMWLGSGRPLATFLLAGVGVSLFAAFSWHGIEKHALKLKNRINALLEPGRKSGSGGGDPASPKSA